MYATPYNEDKNLSFHSLIDPQLQLQHVVTEPFTFVMTIWHSVTTYWAFYLKSTIGILGWLDQPLSDWIYLFYLFFGGLLLAQFSLEKNKVSTADLAVYIVILAATLFANFFLMYLYGSPVSAAVVYGLQGRYFILLIPLIFAIFKSIWQKLSSTRTG